MFVARDKDGILSLFYSKPVRGKEMFYGEWICNSIIGDDSLYEQYMTISPVLFPNLKWEDEPIEVSIIQNNTPAIKCPTCGKIFELVDVQYFENRKGDSHHYTVCPCCKQHIRQIEFKKNIIDKQN